jgi:DNA-binding transcriptional LysR family regulator
MHKNAHIERRLKLHDLRVLMTVIQAGSMLKAAQRLNTSQPAVSRSIAELEQALGVRLLDRSRQGVEPTTYGRALLDCGTAVFDELRRGVKNIEFLTDPAECELTIGANLPAFGGVIPATINRLRREHPRIHIQANLLSDVRQQQRALRERTLDFFVGRLPPTLEKDFEAETLFEEGLVIVAGARNPWTQRRKVHLADLIGEPWVLPPRDAVGGALVAQTFRASGLDLPRNSVASDAVLYMQSLIIHGNFLSFYPSSPLRLGTIGPGFKVLSVNFPVVPSPFGILRLKNRTLSPVAELFIAFAREVVKPLARDK